MSNFKVGDRVEVVSDTYSITHRGSVGIIRAMRGSFIFLNWEKIPNIENLGYTLEEAGN